MPDVVRSCVLLVALAREGGLAFLEHAHSQRHCLATERTSPAEGLVSTSALGNLSWQFAVSGELTARVGWGTVSNTLERISSGKALIFALKCDQVGPCEVISNSRDENLKLSGLSSSSDLDRLSYAD